MRYFEFVPRVNQRGQDSVLRVRVNTRSSISHEIRVKEQWGALGDYESSGRLNDMMLFVIRERVGENKEIFRPDSLLLHTRLFN